MRRFVWTLLMLAACTAEAPTDDAPTATAEASLTLPAGGNLAAAVAALKDGETLEIPSGTYTGGFVVTAKNVTLRGVGATRPVIRGGATTIESRGNGQTFDRLDLTGGTERCFFNHSHGTTIVNSVVHDCAAHGILGADYESGSITIDRSEVHHTGAGDRKHQIYWASDEDMYPGSKCVLKHSYVHDSNGGHDVKSRCEFNDIRFNVIESKNLHALELIGSEEMPEGMAREDGDVVGNLIVKQNDFYVLRFGGDGTGQSNGRYRFAFNTVVRTVASPWRAIFRLFDGLESVEMRNNAFFGVGTINFIREDDAHWVAGRKISGSNNVTVTDNSTLPPEWTSTRTVADVVVDSGYRPRAGSPLLGFAGPSPLPAAFEPSRTLAAVARTAQTAVGAFELTAGGTTTPPVVDAGASTPDASVSIVDAGAPKPDASVPVVDAGAPKPPPAPTPDPSKELAELRALIAQFKALLCTLFGLACT